MSHKWGHETLQSSQAAIRNAVNIGNGGDDEAVVGAPRDDNDNDDDAGVAAGDTTRDDVPLVGERKQ